MILPSTSRTIPHQIRRICTTIPARMKYVQGQTVNGVREYFYYIDHNGHLFLDDVKHKNFTSAYKDIAFVNLFYTKLKYNDTGRYETFFPYLSLCGKEHNFLRCDDRPFVFTKIDWDTETMFVGDSTKSVKIQPSKFCIFPNGRLYHPAPRCDYGLLSDRILTDIWGSFIKDQNRSFNRDLDYRTEEHLIKWIQWNNKRIILDNELHKFIHSRKEHCSK